MPIAFLSDFLVSAEYTLLSTAAQLSILSLGLLSSL